MALPHRVRFLCAYDPELCAAVRRSFVRAVTSFYKRRAKDRGLEEAVRLFGQPAVTLPVVGTTPI